METAAEYLEKTKSSVEYLFKGIEAYVSVLREAPLPVFVASYDDNDDIQKEAEKWYRDNEAAFKERENIEKRYFAESFAQANLCGAVLQVAYMGITLYSQPADEFQIAGESIKKKGLKFCVGRRLRTLPIGLIILGGRNQYMHLEDEKLQFPSNSIFNVLATHSDDGKLVPYRDPAFDIDNSPLISHSSNITALLKWRSYGAYEADMKALLNVDG